MRKVRQLKSINIFNADQVTSADIENIPQIKEVVYEELVKSVENSIKTNKNVAPLFEVNNSGYVIELPKEYWAQSLEESIKFFEGKEEYEKCAFIKKLISQTYEQKQGHQQNNRSRKQHIKRQNQSKKKKEKRSITK